MTPPHGIGTGHSEGVTRHRWDPVAAPPRGLVRPVRAGSPGGPTRSLVADRRWWPGHVTRLARAHVRRRRPARATDPRAVGAASGRRRRHRLGGIRGDDRVVLMYHELPADQVVVRHGIRVVDPERAVVDQLRLVDDPREVVVAIDMLAAAAVVSPELVSLHARTLAPGEQAALELAVSRGRRSSTTAPTIAPRSVTSATWPRSRRSAGSAWRSPG